MLKRIAKLERRLMLSTLRLLMTRMEKIGPLAVEHWYDCQQHDGSPDAQSSRQV